MTTFESYLDTYFESVLSNPRVVAALAEFRQRIAERYPEATVAVERGVEPLGVYLVATIDIEDTFEAFDLVADRMVDLQVEEGMPVYVTVVRPQTRVLEDLRRREAERVGALPRTT